MQRSDSDDDGSDSEESEVEISDSGSESDDQGGAPQKQAARAKGGGQAKPPPQKAPFAPLEPIPTPIDWTQGTDPGVGVGRGSEQTTDSRVQSQHPVQLTGKGEHTDFVNLMLSVSPVAEERSQGPPPWADLLGTDFNFRGAFEKLQARCEYLQAENLRLKERFQSHEDSLHLSLFLLVRLLFMCGMMPMDKGTYAQYRMDDLSVDMVEEEYQKSACVFKGGKYDRIYSDTPILQAVSVLHALSRKMNWNNIKARNVQSAITKSAGAKEPPHVARILCCLGRSVLQDPSPQKLEDFVSSLVQQAAPPTQTLRDIRSSMEYISVTQTNILSGLPKRLVYQYPRMDPACMGLFFLNHWVLGGQRELVQLLPRRSVKRVKDKKGSPTSVAAWAVDAHSREPDRRHAHALPSGLDGTWPLNPDFLLSLQESCAGMRNYPQRVDFDGTARITLGIMREFGITQYEDLRPLPKRPKRPLPEQGPSPHGKRAKVDTTQAGGMRDPPAAGGSSRKRDSESSAVKPGKKARGGGAGSGSAEDQPEKDRWSLEILWSNASEDPGIERLKLQVCSILFARFDVAKALLLRYSDLTTGRFGGSLVHDILTFCHKCMAGREGFYKGLHRRAPGESPATAGLESGRGFRAAMKTLDPFDNLPSLLLMPQLFVDLNEQEVEYARNIARCTQQKEGVQILHNVVKYLQNLLDSGLYMCRLTPEWQAVHALLRHESSGGIAADGARPTEDPEDKDKLEASWRPTHSAPFNAVWQKARQYVASLPPAERSPSFWDPMKPEKQKEIIEQAKKASKFSAAGAIARATDPDPNDMQSDSEEEVVSDAEEVVSDREEEPEDHKGAESAVERSFRTYIRKGCFREQQEQSPSWALLCTVRSIVTHIQRNFKPPLQDPMAGTRGPACSTFPPPREATDAKGVRAHFSRRAELLQSTVTCLRDNSVPDATVVDFRETLSLVAQHVSTQEAQRKGIEGILRRLEAKPKQSPFEAHGAGKKAKKEAPERTLVLDHFSRLLLDLQKELSALDAAVQEWGTAQVEQHDRLKMVRMDELNRGGKTALDTLKILTSAFSKVVVDDDDDPPDLSSGSSSEADSEEVDMDYKDRAPVKKRGDLSSETSSSGDELSRSDSEDPDAVHAAGERMALFGRDDVDDRKRADERYQRYTSTEVLRRLLHLVPRPVQHPAPGEARPAGGALDAYQQGGYPFAMEEPNADTDGFDGVKGTAERIIVLHACHEGLRGLKKSLRGRGGGTKEQKGEALSAITQALALVEAAGMGVGSNQEVGPPEPPMPVQAPKGKKRGYLLHQLMSASKSVSKEIRALEQQGVVASMRKLRTRYEVFGALHTSKAGLLDASDGFKARYREVQALSRRLQVATHTRPSGVWSGRGGLDRLRGQRLCQPRAWKALSVFLFYMCAARDLHEQSVARVHVRDVLREVESRCRQLLLYFDNKESWDTKAALDCAEAILRYDPLHMPMPDDATLSEALTRIDPGMEVAVREKVQEARKALNSLAPAVFPIVSEAALAHSLQKDPSKPSWFGGSPKDWIDGLDGIYEAQMGMPYEDQKTAFLRSAREGWDRERQGRSDDVWGGATKSWWRGWMLCYQARRLTWEACRRATPDTLRLQRRIDAVQAWRCNLDCGAALQRLESLSKQQGSALEARVRDLREPATAGADPSQAPSGAPADPVSDDDEANPDSRADPVAKAEQERKTGLKEAQKSQAALKKAVDEVRQALVEFQGVLATGGLQQRLSEAPPAGRKRFLHLQERAEDEIHCSLHNLQHGLYSLVRSQGKCALKFVEGLLNSLLATQEQKVSEEEQAMLDDAAPAPEIASTGPTEQLEKEDSFFQHGMIADMVEAVEGSEVDLQLVVEIAQRDEKDAAGGSGGATLEKALHTRALYRHFISEDFQNDFFLGALDDRGLDRAQLHDALVDHPSLVRAWFVQVLCVSHNARPRAWTGLAQHPVFHSIVREEGATAAGPAVLGGQEQPNLLPSCSLFECVWAQYTLALRDSLLLRAWSHYRDHRLQAEADVVPGDTSRNDDEAGEDSDAEDVDADPDQGSTLHMEQSQALVRFCLSVLTCGRAMAPALLDHQKLEIDPSAGMCRTDSRTPERQQTRFEEAIFQSFQECYDGRLKPWVIKTKQAFLQKNAKGEKFIAAAMEAFFLRLDERSTGPSQTFVVQNLTAAQRQERLRRIEEGLEVDRLSEIPVLETRPDIPLRFPWVLNGQQINELFQQYIFQEQPMEGVLEGSVADDRYEMNQVHAWLYEDLPEMDDSGPENPAEAVDRYVTISESCRSDPLLETRGHGYSLLQLSELRVCPFFSAVGTVRSVRNEFGSDHSRAAASWLFRHFVPPFGSGYGLLKSPDGLSLYRTLVHVSSVDVARALFGARLEEGALQPVLQALALKPKWSDLVTQDVQKMLSKVLEFYRQRVQLQRDFLLVPGRVLGFVRRVIDYSDQISVLQEKEYHWEMISECLQDFQNPTDHLQAVYDNYRRSGPATTTKENLNLSRACDDICLRTQVLRAQDKNQALPLDAHQTVLFNEMERIDQSQAMEWNRLVGLHMGPLRQLLGSPEHTDLQREAAALRTGLHTASQLSAGATAHLERVLAFLNRRPLPSV